jgi:hypothetical protein
VPFSSRAGLNELAAVWPFTTGSASTMVSVTFCGRRMPSARSSYISTVTFMPSCRNAARSPTKSLASSICS